MLWFTACLLLSAVFASESKKANSEFSSPSFGLDDFLGAKSLSSPATYVAPDPIGHTAHFPVLNRRYTDQVRFDNFSLLIGGQRVFLQ